jgi:hypothetical protein
VDRVLANTPEWAAQRSAQSEDEAKDVHNDEKKPAKAPGHEQSAGRENKEKGKA